MWHKEKLCEKTEQSIQYPHILIKQHSKETPERPILLRPIASSTTSL